MTTLVFGHKSPDTDSTGSPIIWAWYLSEVKGTPAKPVLLGEPNTEAAFVLKHWGLDKPAIIADVTPDDAVVIVDVLEALVGREDDALLYHHRKYVAPGAELN